MAKRSRQRALQGKGRSRLVDPRGKEIESLPKNRIIIGVPCGDQCSSYFAYDLARMVGWSTYGIPDTALRLLLNVGTLIAPQREVIVEVALRADSTHILWIDSDMRFPQNALAGLLQRMEKEGWDVLGANYTRRKPPHHPVAARDAKYVFTHDDDEGTEAVDHTGMGFMLTKVEMFKELEKPYFRIGWNEEARIHRGEDVTFMEQARQKGFSVGIDHDLSKQILHTGSIEYSYINALDQLEFDQRMAKEDEDDNVVRDPADGGPKLAE